VEVVEEEEEEEGGGGEKKRIPNKIKKHCSIIWTSLPLS
jgi:hypothetical protein